MIGLLLALALPASAETARKACVNEIGLFCQGLEDDALRDCLARNYGNATARCQAALKPPPESERAPVWGSKAAAAGTRTPLSPAAAAEEGLSGFTSDLKLEEKRYPLSGATREELEAGLGNSGLRDTIDNGAGVASTGGRLSVAFGMQEGPESCRLTGARVTVSVGQTLPQWDAPAQASAETRDWWSKFFSAIKKHEDGHRDRWVAVGKDAASFLQRMGPSPTCDDLARSVQSEQDAANTDGTRRNVDWDEQTHHGQAQFDEAFGRAKAAR